MSSPQGSHRDWERVNESLGRLTMRYWAAAFVAYVVLIGVGFGCVKLGLPWPPKSFIGVVAYMACGFIPGLLAWYKVEWFWRKR